MVHGIANVTTNLWQSCIHVNQPKQWKSIPVDLQECMYQLLMAMWFICSEERNRSRLYPEFLEFIVKVVVSNAFVTNVKKCHRVQGCYKSMLGIIYQFIINMNKSHQLLYKNNMVARLQQTLTSSSTRNIKGRTALILAYLLTDEQQKQTDVDNAVEFLLTLLRSCVETQNKRVQDFNYSSLEILEGMSCESYHLPEWFCSHFKAKACTLYIVIVISIHVYMC